MKAPADGIHVNGVEIAPAAVAAEAQHHPASSPKAAMEAAAEALVVRELLLQEAARLGLSAEPVSEGEDRCETDEDARIRALLEQEVAVPAADRAACRRYYGKNLVQFRTPEIFEASHILLSAAKGDAEAYRKAVDRAKELIAILQATPSAFAELARQWSACPSGKDGGNLGQLTRGQTTPEFETFLVALEEGQLCPVPVETRYGVHVIRLHRRIAGRQLPFEMVADRIATFLRERAWTIAVRQYLTLLAGRAAIDGIQLSGGSPQVVG